MMTPARTHDFHRAPREENCPVTSGHSGSSVLIDQKRRLFFLKEKSEKRERLKKFKLEPTPMATLREKSMHAIAQQLSLQQITATGIYEVLFKNASCRIKPKANKGCLSPLLFSLIRLCLQDWLPPEAEDLMALFEEGALEACGEPRPVVQRPRVCTWISLE